MSDESKYPEGGPSRFRILDGRLSIAVRWAFIAMPLIGTFFVVDAPFYLQWSILREQYYGLMLAILLPCTFILVPPTKKAPRDRVPWFDFVLAILGIIVGLYLVLFYQRILMKLGDVTLERVIIGTIAFVLLLEASRRVANLFLAIFGLILIILPHFSWLFPEIFAGSRLPFPQQVNYLFLDTNGMLSNILGVALIVVVAFVFFGALLFAVGGGAFITDVSMATLGSFRGGPAKIAVLASSLFASVSGVAVANVATTGVVTIPLMKKVGYKPHVAGAIEAVASTGGQICPPIMGATAFVMAEVVGVPYQKVAVAAVIPALLYFVTVFFQADMEAGKAGLKGLPKEQLPKIWGVWDKSYLFIIPFAILLYTLFGLYLTAEKCALAGVISILILGLLIQKETRFRLGWILEALRETGQTLLLIAPICALAGIVVGTVSYTGLGFLISLYLSQVVGGNLFLLLPIIAMACFIMGMGMPTLPAYIVLAVLMAPAAIQLGVEPIAAHLFILFFAIASMVTPPVCIAAYAAAAISGADPIRTGLVAARFAIVKYIVPFLFIFFPALLFRGSPGEVLTALITAILGCFVMSAALSGFLFKELSRAKRIVLGLASIGLLIPIQIHLAAISLFINLGGGGLALFFIIWEWYGRKRLEMELATESTKE